MLGILQALPRTALWERLKLENRLVEGIGVTELGDQNSLMNFIPTRAIAEIGKEYVEGFWKMYKPSTYLRRCFLQCLKLGSLKSNQQILQMPWTQHRWIGRERISQQLGYDSMIHYDPVLDVSPEPVSCLVS